MVTVSQLIVLVAILSVAAVSTGDAASNIEKSITKAFREFNKFLSMLKVYKPDTETLKEHHRVR